MGFEKSDLQLHKLANKLGLSLDEIVAKGQLPKAVAAKMATNCKSCALPERCENHLAALPERIKAAPSFCVNCRMLSFLSKAL